MGQVVIGMDPHKRSATIEIIDGRQRALFQVRFGTDSDGYQDSLAAGCILHGGEFEVGVFSAGRCIGDRSAGSGQRETADRPGANRIVVLCSWGLFSLWA